MADCVFSSNGKKKKKTPSQHPENQQSTCGGWKCWIHCIYKIKQLMTDWKW